MSFSRNSATLLIAVLPGLGISCASGNPPAQREDNSPVTAEDIANNPNEPIEKLLQAKAPGVEVFRAPGGLIVRLRGSHSFTGTDAPLYVIDGMNFVPGPEGLLSGIDPQNIESIKVVRGSEAALYGMQGMNGVIVIAMKKPEKRIR